MKQTDLESEYAPRAAAIEQARAEAQRRSEAQRQARQAQQAAQPIADDAELSAAVARLAGTWGLKKKARRR